MPRLIDYFAVVGIPEGAGEEEGACIVDRFPVIDHQDFPFPDALALFTFPAGVDETVPRSLQPASTTFSFVLTGGDGSRRYGHCLKFYEESPADDEMLSPKVIALISPVPYFALFRTLLQFLHHMHTRGLAQPAALTNGASNGSASPSAAASPHQPPSLEHYVYSFLRFVKDPSPGRALGLRFGGLQVKVSRPGFRVLPTVDTECMRQLFACLSKENIIQLMKCLLLEQHVVVHSVDMERITLCLEGITALLHPFIWCNVYIPLLPLPCIDCLEAPVPFLVGIHSEYLATEQGVHMLENSISSTVIVHLDFDRVVLPMNPEVPSGGSVLPDLPERLTNRLFAHLTMHAPGPREGEGVPLSSRDGILNEAMMTGLGDEPAAACHATAAWVAKDSQAPSEAMPPQWAAAASPATTQGGSGERPPLHIFTDRAWVLRVRVAFLSMMAELMMGYRQFLEVRLVGESGKSGSVASPSRLRSARRSTGRGGEFEGAEAEYKVKFNSKKFIQSRSVDTVEFMTCLMSTQTFVSFCEDAAVADLFVRLKDPRSNSTAVWHVDALAAFRAVDTRLGAASDDFEPLLTAFTEAAAMRMLAAAPTANGRKPPAAAGAAADVDEKDWAAARAIVVPAGASPEPRPAGAAAAVEGIDIVECEIAGARDLLRALIMGEPCSAEEAEAIGPSGVAMVEAAGAAAEGREGGVGDDDTSADAAEIRFFDWVVRLHEGGGHVRPAALPRGMSYLSQQSAEEDEDGSFDSSAAATEEGLSGEGSASGQQQPPPPPHAPPSPPISGDETATPPASSPPAASAAAKMAGIARFMGWMRRTRQRQAAMKAQRKSSSAGHRRNGSNDAADDVVVAGDVPGDVFAVLSEGWRRSEEAATSSANLPLVTWCAASAVQRLVEGCDPSYDAATWKKWLKARTAAASMSPQFARWAPMEHSLLEAASVITNDAWFPVPPPANAARRQSYQPAAASRADGSPAGRSEGSPLSGDAAQQAIDAGESKEAAPPTTPGTQRSEKASHFSFVDSDVLSHNSSSPSASVSPTTSPPPSTSSAMTAPTHSNRMDKPPPPPPLPATMSESPIKVGQTTPTVLNRRRRAASRASFLLTSSGSGTLPFARPGGSSSNIPAVVEEGSDGSPETVRRRQLSADLAMSSPISPETRERRRSSTGSRLNPKDVQRILAGEIPRSSRQRARTVDSRQPPPPRRLTQAHSNDSPSAAAEALREGGILMQGSLTPPVLPTQGRSEQKRKEMGGKPPPAPPQSDVLPLIPRQYNTLPAHSHRFLAAKGGRRVSVTFEMTGVKGLNRKPGHRSELSAPSSGSRLPLSMREVAEEDEEEEEEEEEEELQRRPAAVNEDAEEPMPRLSRNLSDGSGVALASETLPGWTHRSPVKPSTSKAAPAAAATPPKPPLPPSDPSVPKSVSPQGGSGGIALSPYTLPSLETGADTRAGGAGKEESPATEAEKEGENSGDTASVGTSSSSPVSGASVDTLDLDLTGASEAADAQPRAEPLYHRSQEWGVAKAYKVTERDLMCKALPRAELLAMYGAVVPDQYLYTPRSTVTPGTSMPEGTVTPFTTGGSTTSPVRTSSGGEGEGERDGENAAEGKEAGKVDSGAVEEPEIKRGSINALAVIDDDDFGLPASPSFFSTTPTGDGGNTFITPPPFRSRQRRSKSLMPSALAAKADALLQQNHQLPWSITAELTRTRAESANVYAGARGGGILGWAARRSSSVEQSDQLLRKFSRRRLQLLEATSPTTPSDFTSSTEEASPLPSLRESQDVVSSSGGNAADQSAVAPEAVESVDSAGNGSDAEPQRGRRKSSVERRRSDLAREASRVGVAEVRGGGGREEVVLVRSLDNGNIMTAQELLRDLSHTLRHWETTVDEEEEEEVLFPAVGRMQGFGSSQVSTSQRNLREKGGGGGGGGGAAAAASASLPSPARPSTAAHQSKSERHITGGEPRRSNNKFSKFFKRLFQKKGKGKEEQAGEAPKQ